MSKAFINKIKVYQNQYKTISTDQSKHLKNKYFTDESGSIYFSDSYSIIKLFDTQYNRKQRAEILETFEKGEKLNDQILTFWENFQKAGFNISAEKKGQHKDNYGKEYVFFNDNNLTWDCQKIKRIENIITKNDRKSYFLSDENKNAVCIVGENGVAFLLGCMHF